MTTFVWDIRNPNELCKKKQEYFPKLRDVFGEDQILVNSAIKEAVNNAYLHGNNENEEKSIQLRIRFLSKRMIVRICDEGDGFHWEPYQVTSDVKQWFPTLESIEDRGRGIILLLRVMDVLRYNEKGNECILMKKYTNQE